MKTGTINSSELFNPDLNPTLCFSAYWGLSECHRCNKFLEVLRTSSEMADVYRTLKCIPRIEPDVSEYLIEYFRVRNQYRNIRAKLNYLQVKLDASES